MDEAYRDAMREHLAQLEEDLTGLERSLQAPVVGMRNALVHDYLNLQPERITERRVTQHYKVLFEFARHHLK